MHIAPQKKFALSIVIACLSAIPVFAQLPVCNIVYNEDFSFNPRIVNYNPALPPSATNPAPNTIVPPGMTAGLTVSPILGSGNPTLTFYTANYNNIYMYYDYNSATWVNTGHGIGVPNTSVNPNIGAGGGYIFGLDVTKGNIYRYDGTGDGTLLINVPDMIAEGPNDLVVDCEGNWYLFNQTGNNAPPFLRKYSPAGALLQSWTISNPNNINVVSSGGFAIIGNILYTDDANTNGIASYTLGATTLTLNNSVPLGLGFPNDLGSCSGLVPVSPAVTIAASQNNICTGTVVLFTATTVSGGSTPFYQWKINGLATGNNSATFSYAPANGDIVTCTLTSSSPCANPATVVSAGITMNVTAITPAVSIAITTGSQMICAGTMVNFAATAINPGTTPIYQWKINGTNAGTNSPVFSSGTLVNNDIVTVTLTSNAACLASNNPVSNGIQMTVNAISSPSITISASANNVCENVAVTFTAATTNGGAMPQFKWSINGTPAGSGSDHFTYIPADGDQVSCILISNAPCLSFNNPASNTVIMKVQPLQDPAVTISTPSDMICTGDPVTFTAKAINAGSMPSFQWKVNGANAGTNNPVFTAAALNPNDLVNCTITTSALCYNISTAVSNTLAVPIAPAPVVTLSPNQEILQGGTATLSSSVSEPVRSYTWTPSASLNNPATANPLASPVVTTTYRLDVISVAGCKAYNTTNVKVVSGPVIPNTFTPNGDGINDVWAIKNLETYPNCRVQVFNRYGQLLFQSVGYGNPWNGSYKGKLLATDTYYYILEPNNSIGSKPLKGYVTIIR